MGGEAVAQSGSITRIFGREVFFGWIVMGGCFCMSIVSGAFFYARGVFLPEMADEFGGSRLTITLAFTIAQAVGAFAAPLIGIALDRYRANHVLLAGAVLVTCGYLLTASSDSVIGLYVVFGLFFGAGWMAISSFSTSRVLVRWFKRRRGFALAIDVAGASVAGVFVPVIAVWMMSEFGWRPGFVVFGVLTMVLVVPIIVFLIKSSPEEVGTYPDGEPPVDESVQTPLSSAQPAIDPAWTTRELLAQPRFWAVVLLFSAMACAWQGVNMHLFGHIEAVGFLDQRAALVLSVMAILIVLGKPVLGWVADRFGTKVAVSISFTGQIVGVVLFWLTDTYVLAMLGAIAYGFGLSGMAPLQSMATAAIFGASSYGRANGLMKPFMLPVALVASPIAAWIFDSSGSYTDAFLVFLVFLLAATPVLLLMRFSPPKRATRSTVPEAGGLVREE